MQIERRDFLQKSLIGGAGIIAMASGVTALAMDLPSDPNTALTVSASAEEIILPAFEKGSNFTLDQALMKRQSSRNFDKDGSVSPAHLSRILWAAGGINRPDGHTTTPSAVGRYPIEIYTALREGTYQYEVKAHKLTRVAKEDIREEIPLQPSLKKAAMKLLYVVNSSKLLGLDPWMADLEIGCKVQNVYLEAAALNLGCCVFAMVRFEKITKALGLKDKQKLRIAQAVGPLKD